MLACLPACLLPQACAASLWAECARPADSALLATLPRLRVLAPNDYGLLVEY